MSAFHVGRALAHEGLTPAEKLVLVCITYHANKSRGEVLWHSQSTIADELGMNKKTVREAYKRLEALGLIRRTARQADKESGKRHRTTDLIQLALPAFTFPALEEANGAAPVENFDDVGATDPQCEGKKPPRWGRQTPRGGGATPPLNNEANHEENKQSRSGSTGFGSPSQRDIALPEDDPWKNPPTENPWAA